MPLNIKDQSNGDFHGESIMEHEHDFKRFPELTNAQMDFHYFSSPHKQIFEDFRATIIKVTDGDTVRLRTNFRDFDFPMRMADIAAAELSEGGGIESQSWLEQQILGEEVDILMDASHRVEKWGRLLGKIVHAGLDLGEMSVNTGHAVPWENRKDGKLPDFEKEMMKHALK